MDGWLSCHDSCSLSRCTFVIDSNHFLRESSIYADSKPHIVIVVFNVHTVCTSFPHHMLSPFTTGQGPYIQV